MKNDNLQKLNALYIKQELDLFSYQAKRDIEILRENWGVPIENGFKNESDFLIWQKKNLDIQTYLSKYPNNKTRDIALVKRIFIGMEKTYLKKYQISKSMHLEIDYLLKHYSKPSFYLPPIIGYILFGTFELSELSKAPIFIDFNYKYGAFRPKDYLPLKIYANTTIKDIQALWPEIEKIQIELLGKKPQSRKKVAENYERDKRIYELYKVIGPNYKEISTIIKKQFGKDGDLSDFQIPTVIYRFKKRMDNT